MTEVLAPCVALAVVAAEAEDEAVFEATSALAVAEGAEEDDVEEGADAAAEDEDAEAAAVEEEVSAWAAASLGAGAEDEARGRIDERGLA